MSTITINTRVEDLKPGDIIRIKNTRHKVLKVFQRKSSYTLRCQRGKFGLPKLFSNILEGTHYLQEVDEVAYRNGWGDMGPLTA